MPLSSTSRIIDRDIAAYDAECEHCIDQLRRAPSKAEAYWRDRHYHAHNVLNALRRYRDSIDAGLRPPQDA